MPGLVNVDFADVRTVMAGSGSALMGQGTASGKSRAKDAALAAISSPLLDVGIERATGIVWNITGPPDLTLFEVGSALTARGRLPGMSSVNMPLLQVNTAAEAVYELVDAECNLIFGAVVDPNMQQEVGPAASCALRAPVSPAEARAACRSASRS